MGIDLGSARGRIEIDASGVDQGVKKAQSAMSSFGMKATAALVGVNQALGIASQAIDVMGRAWQEMERGADLSATQDKFERLAESIGSTGDALRTRLQDATNGMMSNAELMASATDIMSLGLGKTEDQTVRLASVVGKLGWDMQQVVLTMANNSKMRLDALGLSVEDVNARVAKLRETGMSLDDAFDLAVIEAGEAKIGLLGDSSERAAGQIDILKASVKNVQDEFARGMAEGFAQALRDVSVGAADTSAGIASVSYGVGALTQYLPALAQKAVDTFIPWGNMLRDVAATTGVVIGLERQGIADIQRGAETADRAMLEFANSTAHMGDNARRAGSELGGLNTYFALTHNNLKLGAERSNKFAEGLDALSASAGRAAAATRQAAEQAAAFNQAFQNVQADYTTELPRADKPLVTPEQTVSVVTQISGPTAEQAALASQYNDELKKLRETYTELTGGVGTFGMEQDKLDAKINETAGEIAYYEGLLANIPPAVNDVSTSQQGLTVNVDAVRQGIYNQLVQMQAAPEIIAAYAAATDIMSATEAEAVLQAAAVKVKIDELAQSIANGMPIDQALADLDAFISKIETGVNPAAATLATEVPARVTEMKDAMSKEALAAGGAVTTNIATGINDNLSEATTAATDAADAVTAAVREAHGIESPSAVFAEIGGQDIAGFIAGVEDAQGDAVSAMEAVGQATVDAWDETIAAADGIGRSIMDGVIAGVEAKRGELVAKMKEIAKEAYAAAMAELQAKSPSRLFMQMGEAIITGIVAGLDKKKDTLYGKLTEVANTLYGIGDKVFGLQSDALERNIDATTDKMTAAFDALRTTFGNTKIDNLLNMSPAERAYFAPFLRGSSAYQNDIDTRLRVDEALRQAGERNRLEQEYIRQQEELAALEEQRSRLDFLQTQVDLLKLIKENNLSTSILDGLKLGLDANMTDILAAMTEATRQLIERANTELGIASPSAVFRKIGEQVMEGLADGLGQTRALEKQMHATLNSVAGLGLADPRALQRRLQGGLTQAIRVEAQGLNPAQNVYIYGGFNPQLPPGGRAEDPLRSLFWQAAGYGAG